MLTATYRDMGVAHTACMEVQVGQTNLCNSKDLVKSFNADCDMPRHGSHTYSMHGGIINVNRMSTLYAWATPSAKASSTQTLLYCDISRNHNMHQAANNSSSSPVLEDIIRTQT